MSDYGMAAAQSYAPSYEKDPSDTIDYTLSWHNLGSDGIVTSSWSSDELTIGSNSVSGQVTACFVGGGTAGSLAALTNTITTGMGRTLQRTVYIAVKEL
jgi:hypothetical protein